MFSKKQYDNHKLFLIYKFPSGEASYVAIENELPVC